MEDLAMIHKRLVVLALLTITSFASAQDLKKTLTDRYVELTRAITAKNAGAVEAWVNRHCAADFVYVSKDKKKYNRKQFLEGLKQQLGVTKKVVTNEHKNSAPVVTGSTATVKTFLKFEAMVLFDKRELRLTDQSETTDRWTKVGNAWKLKSVTQTKAETQIYQK